jgi:hypothetical protein
VVTCIKIAYAGKLLLPLDKTHTDSEKSRDERLRFVQYRFRVLNLGLWLDEAPLYR